jgi:prophage antirepressor-like protein
MELKLDNDVVKIYRFADKPDLPWFQVKPIIKYLLYTNITQVLDKVDPEDRAALKELVEDKGRPLEVDAAVKFGYHEEKALYINESGLYCLVLGSKKPAAVDFKLWITREVLPQLRRTGEYCVASTPIDCVPTVARNRKPPSTATKKPAAVCDNVVMFMDLVKQNGPVVVGPQLKLLTIVAYTNFLKIVAEEEQRSIDSVCAELKDSTFGLKAVVPEKWKEFALAAVADARNPASSSIVTEDVERSGTSQPIYASRGRPQTPFSADGDHGVAKDAANAMWIKLLCRGSRIFFLDSWEDQKGLKLRTLSALLRAGHLPELLFSANPDVAICSQLRLQGVHVQEGAWTDFHAAYKFDGIYLDLCSGSESYVRVQLELATARSEAGCVLGWTLTERDFNGSPLLVRAVAISEFLVDLGWRPAMQRLSASILLHRSSASRFQVLTQFWVKQQ